MQKDLTFLYDFFELGVNYVSSTINQHRLELLLLDKYGNIKITYTRLQWQVENVQKDIKVILSSSSRFDRNSTLVNSIQQVVLPIVLAFFPKCPVCWGVYLSALGVTSLENIPYSPWLIPWIIIAIVVNLYMLFRNSKVRNGLTSFWISLIGAIILILGYVFSLKDCSILGVLLIIFAPYLIVFHLASG
ncbi:MAG: hypothetical protein IPI18_18970 [Saprospiraceae bacterium]|nr:hypothetical protein [Saprospiraceae bacterium]